MLCFSVILFDLFLFVFWRFLTWKKKKERTNHLCFPTHCPSRHILYAINQSTSLRTTARIYNCERQSNSASHTHAMTSSRIYQKQTKKVSLDVDLYTCSWFSFNRMTQYISIPGPNFLKIWTSKPVWIDVKRHVEIQFNKRRYIWWTQCWFEIISSCLIVCNLNRLRQCFVLVLSRPYIWCIAMSNVPQLIHFWPNPQEQSQHTRDLLYIAASSTG